MKIFKKKKRCLCKPDWTSWRRGCTYRTSKIKILRSLKNRWSLWLKIKGKMIMINWSKILFKVKNMRLILTSFKKIWKKFRLKNLKFYRKATNLKKMFKKLNCCWHNRKKIWNGMIKFKRQLQFEKKKIENQIKMILFCPTKIKKVSTYKILRKKIFQGTKHKFIHQLSPLKINKTLIISKISNKTFSKILKSS